MTDARIPSPRQRRVQRLRARYDVDSDHSTHVAHLAQVLFDRTAELHRLGAAQRELLTDAAWLHDIGLGVSQRAHHKHAMRLIRSADLPEFTPREVAIVSQVARYHRKAVPKRKHGPFASLSRPDRQTVCQLAGLLRVADGLDRTHRCVVVDVEVELGPSRAVMHLRTTGDATWEIWAAQRKGDLFTQTFEREIEFRVADTC